MGVQSQSGTPWAARGPSSQPRCCTSLLDEARVRVSGWCPCASALAWALLQCLKLAARWTSLQMLLSSLSSRGCHGMLLYRYFRACQMSIALTRNLD